MVSPRDSSNVRSADENRGDTGAPFGGSARGSTAGELTAPVNVGAGVAASEVLGATIAATGGAASRVCG